MKKYSFFLFLSLIMLLFSLAGCVSTTPTPAAVKVDLNNLQPLPTAQESELLPLRVAIAAVISPEGTAESYAPLLDYLEDSLGRPIELVQRRTYAEINDLIKNGVFLTTKNDPEKAHHLLHTKYVPRPEYKK